jgi:hypothetical protein
MSEYQYYEFRAIDRPLTNAEMASLRKISSRGHITSTSFVNVYNYGDFRGDPQKLMAKCFDAFLYVANWGTHTFMLRVPRPLGSRECAPFLAGESLSARYGKQYTVLCFSAEELETDWEEGDGLIDSLLPIREDLIRGDYRALYIGWLSAIQHEQVDDSQLEPPVPAGLCDLSPALTSLVEFLDIDSDLLEVSAEASANRKRRAPSNEILSAASPGARTAGELYAASELRRAENIRRREERQAAERTKYLDSLERREAQIWVELDLSIATKRPSDYDQAVTTLTDLRDLANRKNGAAEFRERLLNLRARHATKPSFLRKLKAAELGL